MSFLSTILIGAVSSIIASVLTFCFIWWKNWLKNRSRFKIIEGFYHGKTFDDPTRPVEFTEPTSHASVEYLKDNKLQIELTDFPYSGHNKWIGEIIMDSENTGSIIWHYVKHENIELSKSKHLFGIKRVIYRPMGEDTFLYLVDTFLPDNQGNYLKEVLKKIK